ncbi:hypothetical protein DFQ26_008402 [Actinomortierella ambigua]|nr:hypothetical protein DFQ26_008402 [Actinomortierella ambigua]
MKIQLLRNSLLFVAVAMISTAQQGPAAPRPVAKASYAKHHNKLYVYGGREIQESPRPALPQQNSSGQFFVLDLSKPWRSALPAWSRLPDGPEMPNAGAVISQDGKIFVAFKIEYHGGSVRFRFEQNSWNHSSSGIVLFNEQSPVVLQSDGTVLAKVGVKGPLREEQINMTSFYSFESDSGWGDKYGYPYTNSTVLPAADHKAVWSDYLESAVFYGGSNLDYPGSPSILRLYHPQSKEWTWKTTEGHNSYNFNHCVAITDDGKRLFVYGGGSAYYTRDDFAILDLETFRWSKAVTKGPLRKNTVCTVAGDYFLLWGVGGGLHTISLLHFCNATTVNAANTVNTVNIAYIISTRTK